MKSLILERKTFLFTRSSDYKDHKYYFYYDIVISNQYTEYRTKLFCRICRVHGTSGLSGNYKQELEELDEPKVVQGLKDYFSPLLSHLSSDNALLNGDSVLNDLFRTIGSVKPVLNNEEPNRVCYKRRITLNFLDKATAREQKDESRIKERESALFEGSIKWISFRFHFSCGKGEEMPNRMKLVLTVINSMGVSMEYNVFDFRCNADNYKGWYRNWVSFVNTEGKINITKILNRLSGYHDCVSSLLELKSIDTIINNITGRYDFEIPFNFSDSSESENKGKKQRAKKTPNDKTSIWLGLLGLEAMPDSLDALRKAYRNACFAFHPDRFTDAGKKTWAEEQLKIISNAFDELSKLYA